ncbi:MAG: hypothetical protein KF902_02825 [Phycisphaeraceae bacterium]|nr:hypothetical protein [Phycisphaeraceae bacterium]
MSEQLEQRRLVRLLICGLAFAGCAGTVLVSCCFGAALPLLREGLGGQKVALPIAGSVSMTSVFACLFAMPLLVHRSRLGFEKPFRVVVSILCALAAVMNVVAFGLEGIAYAASPAVASVVVWVTPTPLPPYCCHKCGYDLRGTPRVGERPRCPECGSVRLTRDAEIPS